MLELATAAVEAALAAGARYADARVMIIRHESMEARNRVVEDLAQTETAGIGVRALIGSSWGFQATPTLTAAAARGAGEGRGRRGPGLGPGRPARRSTWRRRRWSRPSGPRPGRVHPLDDVSLAEKGDLLVAATGAANDAGVPLCPGQLPGVGHREVVRVQRGQPRQPAPRRVRGGGRRHRHRRRRDPAPLVPRRAGPVRHAGLGAGARPRPRGQRRPDRPSRPSPCWQPRSAPRALTTVILDSDQVALQIHESVGPRRRARPHPRLGGGVRRHLVARARPSSATCASAAS